MQKIVIKNFGAIVDAEIDVKRVLVLIGEQASGKSTIAKLIYFFKSLRDDLFEQIYKDANKEHFDIVSDLIFPIREKFYDFFGSTYHLPNFEITFYYNVETNRYLSLTLDNRKKLHPTFSDNFISENFRQQARQIKKLLQQGDSTRTVHEQLAFEQDKLKYAQRLSVLVNSLFENLQDDALFVIAGRNATVSYSGLFEKYLFADIQSKLEEQSKQSFRRKEQTIDETLMLRFMERVVKIKEVFRKFDGFEGLIQSRFDETSSNKILPKIVEKVEKILKGKYSIDNLDEKIIFNDTGGNVHLSNSSSGQQESIRILQDIFLVILDNRKSLRIVEEPEAHLFPVAQKQTIELLALMLNQNSENQLIITTHSPYVLTVFNNLLFAKRVVEKNIDLEEEVEQIISKDFHLDSEEFSAYSLGGQFFESEAKYCELIFNSKTSLIDQNYLDTVSELLSGDFNQLYSLHTKTFGRK
jgi:predicted ATP-dependent endonuclease of OLD family